MKHINFFKGYDDINKGMTILWWLIVLLLSIGLIKSIFGMFTPPPVPTDMSMLGNVYLRLPLIVWIIISIGIMFGLTFHGFKVIHIERRSSSNTVTSGDKQ